MGSFMKRFVTSSTSLGMVADNNTTWKRKITHLNVEQFEKK